jgi:hypothetical protein
MFYTAQIYCLQIKIARLKCRTHSGIQPLDRCTNITRISQKSQQNITTDHIPNPVTMSLSTIRRGGRCISPHMVHERSRLSSRGNKFKTRISPGLIHSSSFPISSVISKTSPVLRLVSVSSIHPEVYGNRRDKTVKIAHPKVDTYIR